jgi:Type I phosphodiesterase / nucleotide pyrophosphatase
MALAQAPALTGCGGTAAAPTPVTRVIEIDVDDHGLAGLALANAPNLKGLIARGTLGYSRVVVPTHSNQNNMSLLTGQYPDGDDVPGNAWLARDADFMPPVHFPGLEAGDYILYDKNPLLTRGDGVYAAARRHGLHSAYVGELPPFEAGADDVHLSVVGADLGPATATRALATDLLTQVLGYPAAVVARYGIDGPPAAGETQARFTLRDAATYVRATSATHPMPAFMFVWDFVALDDDPTSQTGANGAGVIKIIEDYDAGLGELMAALADKGLLDSTNFVFTLDHGKVDTHNQVVLGTQGGGGGGAADGQLGALVAARSASLGISTADYAVLNEDGDAQLYAEVAGAGTAAGAARQAEVTRALLTLVQSGAIIGLDPTRTLTSDGALGTRRFEDFRATSPHQADLVVFPADDWTLNQVDGTNAAPGPFVEHAAFPYGRHGGFSVEELYVPLVLSGPAFKRGVMLPHPVAHPEVAPTALAALGVALDTAALGPISAALVDDPGETLPQPPTLEGARQTALEGSGFLGAPALAGPPATAAVVIDVASLYEAEVFDDGELADAAGPLRAVAAGGARFEDFWTPSRDWPVSEYELLVGGPPPLAAGLPTAESDPAVTLAPGAGLLLMPPAPRFAANAAGYAAWRRPGGVAAASLFDAAHALGLTTALVGAPDFEALHVDAATIDVQVAATTDTAADAVRGVLAAHAQSLVLVALGGARAGDRHAPAAAAELAALAGDVAAVVAAAQAAAPRALVVVTSRGATAIDDPAADAYGPGSSRHVPFILVGPNVRAGVVTSQPGQPADVPATVLFGLGAPARTDFADGTWATGGAVGGIAQPTPSGALAGHALLRAYDLTLGAPSPAP